MPSWAQGRRQLRFAVRQGKTVGTHPFMVRQMMSHKSNGFDGLRLAAAVMVIYGHAFPLTGHIAPGFLSNGIQTIGVKIFFVISGFLITKSWRADPDLYRYVQKRVFRIMPGLICVSFITVLLLGPAVTTLNIASYFLSPSTWTYFWNILLFPIYNLPGVFGDNIYKTAVNGSLWSLPVEVAMYISVPLVCTRRVLPARVTVILAASVLLLASITFVRVSPPSPSPVIWGTSVISALDASFYFFAGSVAATYELDRFSSAFASSVMLIIAALSVQHFVLGEVILALLLPYFVISVGVIRSSVVGSLLNGRDYSYGLYLYGFPIQQLVVYAIGPQSALTNALISLPAALLCAMASWHFIESRALALKKRLPNSSQGGPYSALPVEGSLRL